MNKIKIGVVGYSAQKFEETEAVRMLREAYDSINSQYADKLKVVVSGLTDLGIPALAYREAISRNWRTMGIACSKAKDYDCFPVDEEIIVGSEWGDESQTFLESLDVLVRVGGGKQALRETVQFRESGKPVLEYNLPAQL